MGINISITVFETSIHQSLEDLTEILLGKFYFELKERKPNLNKVEAYSFLHKEGCSWPEYCLAVSQYGKFIFFMDRESSFVSSQRPTVFKEYTKEYQVEAFTMTNSDTADIQMWWFYKNGKNLRSVSLDNDVIDRTGQKLRYEDPDEDGFTVLDNFALSFDNFGQMNWQVIKVSDMLKTK